MDCPPGTKNGCCREVATIGGSTVGSIFWLVKVVKYCEDKPK